jgi:hypothetical protein
MKEQGKPEAERDGTWAQPNPYAEAAEMVHLMYILNMLVIGCCEINTTTTQTISHCSQKTSTICSEFRSGT